jgi:FkbM family methyltransferase
MPFTENKLELLLEQYKIKAKNIIHGGAHRAEEKESYNEIGIEKVIWIEANPHLANILKKDPRLSNDIIVDVGLSDVEETVDFKIASNSYSSSILDMKEHLKVFPSIVQNQTIKIKTKTLNNIIKDLNVDMDEYNILALDIQGYELHALKGANEILPYLDCIYSEVNYMELYENGAMIKDVDKFLKNFGFRRVYTSHPTCYANALYVHDLNLF